MRGFRTFMTGMLLSSLLASPLGVQARGVEREDIKELEQRVEFLRSSNGLCDEEHQKTFDAYVKLDGDPEKFPTIEDRGYTFVPDGIELGYEAEGKTKLLTVQFQKYEGSIRKGSYDKFVAVALRDEGEEPFRLYEVAPELREGKKRLASQSFESTKLVLIDQYDEIGPNVYVQGDYSNRYTVAYSGLNFNARSSKSPEEVDFDPKQVDFENDAFYAGDKILRRTGLENSIPEETKREAARAYTRAIDGWNAMIGADCAFLKVQGERYLEERKSLRPEMEIRRLRGFFRDLPVERLQIYEFNVQHNQADTSSLREK